VTGIDLVPQLSRADLEGLLPSWRITDDEAFDASGLPRPLRRVEPRMYRLKRCG
jgi:hypothetical protein